jgi:hypothetical protein
MRAVGDFTEGYKKLLLMLEEMKEITKTRDLRRQRPVRTGKKFLGQKVPEGQVFWAKNKSPEVVLISFVSASSSL